MKFKVLTDICTHGDKGTEVDLDDSPAVRALVAAGHLKVVASTPKPKTGK